ncbi:MAG: amidohydrolase family protein, partial [Chitinophagaceae bacterium]
MNYFKQFYHLALISWLFIFPCCTSVNKTVLNSKTSTTFYSVNDFAAVEKFDTHVHLNTYDTPFINQARSDNFRLLDIVDERPFGIPMQEQEKIAILQSRSFPGEVIYATTFSVKNWGKVRWQQDAIDSLKQSFQNGAIAVKVWKNIGMELKDKNGNFIMIDDPSFDPILGYLEKNNITLIGHLGEPRECWLPLEQMVLHRSYYGQHPEYHMYLHPEYPSYESQIQARDHMLEKHPGLRFVGAHLGSLEWSLEELAKRLDKYPNMAVDLARMSNLFLHAKNNWQTTHDFFINYQDRLLYATDVQVEQS